MTEKTAKLLGKLIERFVGIGLFCGMYQLIGFELTLILAVYHVACVLDDK